MDIKRGKDVYNNKVEQKMVYLQMLVVFIFTRRFFCYVILVKQRNFAVSVIWLFFDMPMVFM